MNSPVTLTNDLAKKSRLLALAGDETRIRILCLMFETKETCVTEIAQKLNMSVASISHHLRLMKDNDLLICQRYGTTICYSIAKNKFTDGLKKLICNTNL